MRRREFIKFIPGAAVTPGLVSTNISAATSLPGNTEVDVKKDFGAKGDGIADDWQAIENAGLFLQARGGGRMYFPTGRYLLANAGKNITVHSNIEYYGDGHSSVILGSNAAFISPHGAFFGRSSYSSYTYYPAQDIQAGDQSITAKNITDASRFKPGDIIIGRSAEAIITPGDVLPYYVEMNRVVAVKGNNILLEDPIDDGWSGVIIANVTAHVAQGYSIHDLRIECEDGYPFFIQASYKSSIRNCWTRGLGVFCCNGFTRSTAHDLISTVSWTANGTMAALIEIETGSVRANLHDIDIQISGSAKSGAQFPLFYCQEFSRRTCVRNIRVAGSALSMGIVIMAMAGGHIFENIHVLARSIDKVLDYSCSDPTLFSLNHLPTSFKGITVETLDAENGFNHGFILSNRYPNGTVENVTVQDCVIHGTVDASPHNLIWFLQGLAKNVLFENVRGPADIAMNTEGLSPSNIDLPDSGRLNYPLMDVQIRNCEYRRITSETMLEQCTFANNRRKNSKLPKAARWPSTRVWRSNTPNQPMMALTIPPNATVCWGDYVEVQLSAWYHAYGQLAHLAVKAFDKVIATVDLRPSLHQAVEINLRIYFVDHAFVRPDKYTVSGTIAINNNIVPDWKHFVEKLDLNIPNTIEVQAWTEQRKADESGFVVKMARIEYVCVES